MKLKLKESIKKIICKKSPAFSCPQHQEVTTSIPEITLFETEKDLGDFKRLNLFIPSVNRAHVFGGISTAITFFKDLLEKMPSNYHARIIVTDASDKNRINDFDNYFYSNIGEKNNSKFQVVICNDRSNKKLPILRDDIFIATAWWTAYILKDIVNDQKNYFDYNLPFIYLIQDFEPCFYSWSARYALADSTYTMANKIIAVYNSKELNDYMHRHKYSFFKDYYFLPKMNEKLKNHWNLDKNIKKKKQIIIYGRPTVERNLFPIILEALKIWASEYKNTDEWRILSLGEKHDDIDLGNNIKLISKGKITLDEYAEILIESSLGVSLMLSPHPSYPPLEMAYFGVLTITNNYENKNLETMHNNITSVSICEPKTIAQKLLKAASLIDKDINVGLKGEIKDKSYIDNNEQFDFMESLKLNLANEVK